MNKIHIGVMVAAALVVCGCSKEDRDEMIERTAKAAKNLNGEVVDNTKERSVPTIVEEQQKKERVRQNTQWTVENQALHPIEYCQAQLAETAKMGQQLDVQQHALLVAKSSLSKKLSDLNLEGKDLAEFLAKAKAAYREAELKDSFPIQLNGYAVGKDKAQTTIIAANRKLVAIQAQLSPNSNSLMRVERRLTQLVAEQQKVIALKEKLQSMIGDLRTKQVIEGERGIRDSLRAIEDSMTALQSTVNEPEALDIMIPDGATQQKREFEDIMSK